MEQRAYQKWTRGLLLGLVLVLTACAAVVYRVDPCFYYRMPTDREPVFFSERYQTAGIVRNNPADVVLLGSSMTANCYGSQLETVFGGTGLRLTIPDGYFSEFDQVMGLLMRTHPPKRVLFAMDTNIFTRSPDGVTGAMPDYLYDSSTINDVKYLLNKDVLYYSLYALMAQRWDEGETLDKGFSWMDTVWWNHMTALEEYTRPDIAPEPMPRDGLLADAAKNLAVAASWAERYPEVEFDFYFSPYSILYWDKIGRQFDRRVLLVACREAVLDRRNAAEVARLAPVIARTGCYFSQVAQVDDEIEVDRVVPEDLFTGDNGGGFFVLSRFEQVRDGIPSANQGLGKPCRVEFPVSPGSLSGLAVLLVGACQLAVEEPVLLVDITFRRSRHAADPADQQLPFFSRFDRFPKFFPAHVSGHLHTVDIREVSQFPDVVAVFEQPDGFGGIGFGLVMHELRPVYHPDGVEHFAFHPPVVILPGFFA